MGQLMDVALVIPPVDLSVCTEDPTMERIGVGYLASLLEKNNFSVNIWHCPASGLDVESACRQLMEVNPLIVGISVLFSHTDISGMFGLVEHLRQSGYQGHITIGGPAATFLAAELLEKAPGLNSVVRGEGELTLLELTSRIKENKDWRNIDGISYLAGTEVVHNSPRALIEDLDDLPLPKRTHAHWSGMIASSRGCPYSCTFCSVHPFYKQSHGKIWRARSAKNIVEEMVHLKKVWGVKQITFVDDNFIGPGKAGIERAIQLANELIKQKVRIDFLIDSRVDSVDETALRLLKIAGLKTVFLGIESGSQRTLDFLNKKTTVEMNKTALEKLAELGIDVLIGFITFDPFTTLQDLKDNIRFYRETGLDRYPATLSRFFTRLNVFAGTPLVDILKQKGVINDGPVDRFALDIGYHYSDPVVSAFSRVAQGISNHAGRSYVISAQYRHFYEKVSNFLNKSPGMTGEVLEAEMQQNGLLKPEVFRAWNEKTLKKAFETFSELVNRTDMSLASIKDEDGLWQELNDVLGRNLTAVDLDVLGLPFDQVIRNIKAFQKKMDDTDVIKDKK